MGDAEGNPIPLAEYTEGTDTYLCKMFTAPEVPSKKHILEVDAIIERSEFVHHILLYHCVDIAEEDNPHWFEPGECRMGCMSIAAAWAVGGYSRYHYPEHVGFPFGGLFFFFVFFCNYFFLFISFFLSFFFSFFLSLSQSSSSRNTWQKGLFPFGDPL